MRIGSQTNASQVILMNKNRSMLPKDFNEVSSRSEPNRLVCDKIGFRRKPPAPSPFPLAGSSRPTPLLGASPGFELIIRIVARFLDVARAGMVAHADLTSSTPGVRTPADALRPATERNVDHTLC